MSRLIYLYGFVSATAPSPPAPPGLDGIAEAAIELFGEGAARAAISRVPDDAYSASAIEARIDDLTWVAAQGVAHERVVSWFVDHGDIVPVPLFTLYSGEEALAADLRARGADVEQTLARIAGLREWDVKLAYDPAALERAIGTASAAVARLDADIAAATPGRRFLLQRKRAELVRDEVHRVAAERADALLAALAGHARAVTRLAIPATSERMPVVLHAALLVARADEPALESVLDAERAGLETLGFGASLTGPWAPYRFLAADDAAGSRP
jgi:hypothetical protein